MRCTTQRRKYEQRLQSAQQTKIARLASAKAALADKKAPPEDPLERVEQELDSPRMALPEAKENLFVLKNVGRF